MSASDVIKPSFIYQRIKNSNLAPLINRKTLHLLIYLENLRNKGYVRAMIDGVMVDLMKI